MKSSREKPEFNLVIAPEAISDITDILQYTIEKWGQEQAITYKKILDKGLTTLCYDPELGHARVDVPSDYRALQTGQHIMLYRIEDKTVYVIRVLHSSMNFSPKIE